MLVGPVTKRATRHLHCDVCYYLLQINNVHTLICLASEWAKHGLQGTFPHCKKHLPSNLVQQCLVLKAIVHVHNFQTEYVGGNQIKTLFDTGYVQVQNLHSYDRIAQYYFHPGEYNSEVDGSGSKSDDK